MKEEICNSNIKNTNNTTKIIKLIIKLNIVIMIIITKIRLIVKTLVVMMITTLKIITAILKTKLSRSRQSRNSLFLHPEINRSDKGQKM